jgi:hypothetical protein
MRYGRFASAGSRVAEAPDRADVSVCHVLLRHATDRAAGSGKQRRGTVERPDSDPHVSRFSQGDHERLLTPLRMAGQAPVPTLHMAVSGGQDLGPGGADLAIAAAAVCPSPIRGLAARFGALRGRVTVYTRRS